MRRNARWLLRPTRAVDIGGGSPQKLVAPAPEQEMADADRMTTLLTQTQEIMNLNEGGFDMWVTDAPTQTMEPPAIYMAANKTAARQAGAPHKLGVCRVVRTVSEDVDPALDANLYVGKYLNSDLNIVRNADGSRRTDIIIAVTKQPAHGTLTKKHPDATNFRQYEYQYSPDEDKSSQGNEHYTGNDDFVMEVSAAGISVQGGVPNFV